ncbi:hypothetical protein ACIQOV_20070 [Kitasatospora sp. NPDC091257]|uniref:hypothetical protein n=1 Tax=unclassified Kitasatospora TaxID=2633591 RepID=UPI002F912556
MTIATSNSTYATSKAHKIALGAAALAVAATSVVTGSTAAHASTSTTISGWNTYSDPWRCTTGSDDPTFWCLYYNSGAEGAVYKSNYREDRMAAPYGYFQADAYGSRGAGQRTWHNAASVENSAGCNLGIFTEYGSFGDANWVPPYRGGNLTSAVKNKNEWAGIYC